MLIFFNSGARTDPEEDLHQLGQRSAGEGECSGLGLDVCSRLPRWGKCDLWNFRTRVSRVWRGEFQTERL